MEKPAEPFESVILIAILTIVGQGAPSFGNSLRRPGGKKHHQTIRFRIRKRSKQHYVDHRKYPGVSSNAQRQRYANYDRKFFFIDPATTDIYTLSLHDALPI